MLILGDQHRPLSESLEVEFKEFCFHDNNNSEEYIYEIIKTGTIKNSVNFNQEIYKNILYYFYKYIPKYTSAFVNANINGNLIFGVNDFGEITGIPFIGTKQELQKYIDNISIKHLLREYDSFEITCNIEQLNIDINYIDNNIKKLLKEYYFNVKQKELIVQKYKNDRLQWCNKMYEYTCKLPLLLINKKEEFDNYLKIHAPQHLNYIIKSHEMRHIRHLKSDPSHYIYWLMKFKDLNLDKLKLIKPILQDIPKIKNSPVYLYKHLTNLRYHFIKNNKNLNYFIINIHISSVYQKNSSLFYYDIDKQLWTKKIRKIHKDIPQCE